MRFIIVIIVMGGLVAFLHARFPYVLKSEGDMARVTYLVGMIALIAAGTWATGRYRFSDILKYTVIWVSIILGLVLVYTYRDQLQWKRIQAELFPNQIRVSGDGGLSVQASADGHFHIEAEINGAPVNFMVDTGASDIVLSPRDAQRAGYMLDMLEYTRLYNTANGTGAGAPVTINSFKVGYAVFQHIPASVNNAPMDTSLLGMSFLRQFKSYRVDGDVLTLVP